MRRDFLEELNLEMEELQGEGFIVANGQPLEALGHTKIKFRSAKYW
jgi:hypothetical protein